MKPVEQTNEITYPLISFVCSAGFSSQLIRLSGLSLKVGWGRCTHWTSWLWLLTWCDGISSLHHLKPLATSIFVSTYKYLHIRITTAQFHSSCNETSDLEMHFFQGVEQIEWILPQSAVLFLYGFFFLSLFLNASQWLETCHTCSYHSRPSTKELVVCNRQALGLDFFFFYIRFC